ncbi:hypothetical protein ACNKFW_01110 [Paracoccus sp. TD-10]|uniref:hypothetical protein n=1 Tax=Paracoccus sp. TD-10 TaxID=3395918 RepID=UPI003AAC6D50
MYDEPGFSKSVGMPTICSGAPYPFVLLRLIFLFFALVTPARRKTRRVPGFCFLVFALFPFYSLGKGMGGGQSPPQGAPFFIFGLLVGGSAALSFCLLQGPVRQDDGGRAPHTFLLGAACGLRVLAFV